MPQLSHLSRYQPAVLAVTSIVAVCSIYFLYSTYTERPQNTGLHRSNAVHRPRATNRLRIEVTSPTAEAPLGNLVLRKGRESFIGSLSNGMPDINEIMAALGDVSEESYTEAQQVAVYGILLNCAQAEAAESHTLIASTPFAGLLDLFESRDDSTIGQICDFLSAKLPDVDAKVIDQALRTLLSDGLTDNHRDMTGLAETETLDELNNVTPEPSQGLKGLLYYIAEDDAKRKAYEHRGITCEECGESPIRGVRWHCLNCPDFDLCYTCEATTTHLKMHVFVKIKVPLPVLSQPSTQTPSWYTGSPTSTPGSLDSAGKKRLAQQYRFEEPSIDALYDQFTCMANVPWAEDLTNIRVAINRQAFNLALTPDRWPNRHAPNVLYDRMFAHYDTDTNGLIGFEEFVSGLSYLRGPERFTPLRFALQGFDIDGDGFVGRSDFLRLLRAKYFLQQQLVRDMIEGQQAEQTTAAMDTLRSSQPISSIFNQEDIPRGEARPSRGKHLDAFGDMQPLSGTKTILSEDDPWPVEDVPRIRNRHARDAASRERLQEHLSRFEEHLYDPSSDADSGHQLRQTEREMPSPRLQAEIRVDSGPEYMGPVSDLEHQAVQPSLEDALLQVVEDGLNELLDTMFASKERDHDEAVSTRDERQTWRAEIQQAVEAKRKFEEELQSAAMVDPLMAIAVGSFATAKVNLKDGQPREPPLRSQLVPTDTESLRKREVEIAQQPLEDLLASSGYGTVDAMVETPEGVQHLVATESATMIASQIRKTEAGDSSASEDLSHASQMPDPTMPQNKPDMVRTTATESPHRQDLSTSSSPRQTEASSADAKETHTPPSRRRLEWLGTLSAIDTEMDERGGPGRLSLDEVEHMVQADSTKELRGLVTSWLEWASF